jgi:hypothetical protein
VRSGAYSATGAPTPRQRYELDGQHSATDNAARAGQSEPCERHRADQNRWRWGNRRALPKRSARGLGGGDAGRNHGVGVPGVPRALQEPKAPARGRLGYLRSAASPERGISERMGRCRAGLSQRANPQLSRAVRGERIQREFSATFKGAAPNPARHTSPSGSPRNVPGYGAGVRSTERPGRNKPGPSGTGPGYAPPRAQHEEDGAGAHASI